MMKVPGQSAELDFARELDFSQILTNPILDIAARVWDEERYDAFKITYRSMRRIDDLVDNRKAEGEVLTDEEIRAYGGSIERWLTSVRRGESVDPFVLLFLKTLDRFEIPLWPWERLCRAMLYDLEHNGFASFLTFLRYAEGAAIAPASVFMHLCGVRTEREKHLAPIFDVRRAARPLAIFSYLTHILRDFEKDQKEGLNYFADNILGEYGLTLKDLHRIAFSGEPTEPFRRMVRRYVDLAAYYRERARRTIAGIAPYLRPRYQLSLALIDGLYDQIIRRVDPEHGLFTTAALNPDPSQVQERIQVIIENFRPVSV